MIADIARRLDALRAVLREVTASVVSTNGATVDVPARLLRTAQEKATDVLRDVVAACPNPGGHEAPPGDRLTWGLEHCGDADECPLDHITMDVAFVVGSLDRVEQDPAWVGAYLPQAAGRLDRILADWARIEPTLPNPADPLSCPGGRARVARGV